MNVMISDIEFAPEEKIANASAGRRVKMPMPAPASHHDISPWHTKLLDMTASTNPHNHVRERLFWDKVFNWSVDDPRLSATPTPPDMLLLDVTIREQITSLAANYAGLPETLKSHAGTCFGTIERTLPARRAPALFYENSELRLPL